MMQFFAVFIIAILSTTPAWSSCGKTSVEVPFSSTKDVSCYRELTPFSITLESISNERVAQFQVNLYEIEHENIPHASTVQYLNFDQENIQILSFLCSGETPVVSDAYSANLKNLIDDKSATDTGTLFISTGQAAENISVDQRKKIKAKIYDKFLELYETSGPDLIRVDDDNDNVYIPNVLLMQTSNRRSKTDRQVYSNYFSKTGSSINGCSKKFMKKMAGYSIKEILKTRSFDNIEIRRRSKDSQKIEILLEF